MRTLALTFCLLASAAACAMAQEATTMKLTSPAFSAGQPIPKKYTCEGDDTSPPLAWTGSPPGTRSFALIVDDPDAPDPAAPKRTYVHWVLYNLPATAASLSEGASSAALPAGAVQGHNDWGRASFGGPCPPIGRHRYFFKLYALDTMLPTGKVLDKPGLLAAMHGHILVETELMGTYQKGD
jgi:Raf kinase inhibitor-like YbhB/YbcL family protein